MIAVQTFGGYIKQLRELKGYPLRKVAAALDIDPSTLSKIEKGDRNGNKIMVAQLARLFDEAEENLNLILLSDKIAFELYDEKNPEKIMEVAGEKIKYLKAKNMEQGEIKFLHD